MLVAIEQSQGTPFLTGGAPDVRRVVVAGPIHHSGLAVFERAGGFDIEYLATPDPSAMEPYLGDAEAVLLRTQPLNAAAIARAPKLKIVSRHGVGFDAVDVDALTERAIPLTIVGDVNARTVAEHAIMLLLAASRRLPEYEPACRPGGNWSFRDSQQSREISGKRLLIIGFGRIGGHLATMASGFGIEITAHDPMLDASPTPNVKLVDDLDAALADADLISIHAPATQEPFLDAARIRRLKPSAIVVNTSRGGAVDETALAKALSSGRLHAAGIDVFEDEPPAADHPLAHTTNAVLTPHAAALTQECAERMAVAAAKNVVDYFAGRLELALVVNAQVLGPIGKSAGATTGVGGHQ